LGLGDKNDRTTKRKTSVFVAVVLKKIGTDYQQFFKLPGIAQNSVFRNCPTLKGGELLACPKRVSRSVK
jgi:hypothetical protein